MQLYGWRHLIGRWAGIAAALAIVAAACAGSPAAMAQTAAPPASTSPVTERFAIAEIALPPVAPSDRPGACSAAINPNGTGCMSGEPSALQVGGFLADGKHLLATIRFTGAPVGSPYPGDQIVLIKADGSRFANGDPWKCLTCGLAPAGNASPASNAPSSGNGASRGQRDRPQVFRDGKRLLAGSTIYDCAPYALTDEACNGATIKAYPIHWQVTADDSGPGGQMRALRLHPDNEHIGFNAACLSDGRADQFAYIARLRFDRGGPGRAPRYALDYVNLLFRPGIANRTVRPDARRSGALQIDHEAIEIVELRGFTANGGEAVYLGYPWESSNPDLFAADLVTGKVRRLTSHPDLAFGVGFSPDGRSLAIADTRGSDRLMFAAGLRGVPPITDLLTAPAVAALAGNGARRFLNLVLLDAAGDRSGYYGQVLTAGSAGPGSAGDPDWNVTGDPQWSPEGTRIAFSQALVSSPACGGASPLPCPRSTAPGGRRSRLLLAGFPDRSPTLGVDPFAMPDQIPWATPYVPGDTTPQRALLPAGNYELKGQASGRARIVIAQRADGKALEGVSVSYENYSNDGKGWLNGEEAVSEARIDAYRSRLLWQSNLAQAGARQGRKLTGPEGLSLGLDMLLNRVEATGSLATAVAGKSYGRPRGGT